MCSVNGISSGLSGLQSAAALFNRASANLVSDTTTDDSGPAISDIAGDVVQMTIAKHLYSASAQIIRASDQMMGTLLDITSRANDANRR